MYKYALGQPVSNETVGVAEMAIPTSQEERVNALEAKVAAITKKFQTNAKFIFEKNKDGIPIGTILMGVSNDNKLYALVVGNDNNYYINGIPYQSITQVAEMINGAETNGRKFWKLMDGRTVEEAFI